MNSGTQKLSLKGEAGVIEALLDVPDAVSPGVRGTVVIAHPHPLFGGTMQNKVVQTLARAFVQCGWRAVQGIDVHAGELATQFLGVEGLAHRAVEFLNDVA